MQYVQEAVEFGSGSNFLPVMMRYRLPSQKNDVSIYLLSDSYEYDIELIKNMPPPRIDYKYLIIPYRVMTRLCQRPFRYILSQNEYNRKILYLNEQKLVPKIMNIRYPYPKEITNNVYISFSDIIKLVTPNLKPMSIQYIQDNIFDIFDQVTKLFNFSKKKVLYIDTQWFPIYKTLNNSTYKTDLINALLTSYIMSPSNKIKKLDWTFIFRAPNADYKFDLSLFDSRDVTRLRAMLNKIGIENPEMSVDVGDSIDSFTSNEDDTIEDVSDEDIDSLDSVTDTESSDDEENDNVDEIESDSAESDDTEEIKDLQKKNKSTISSIKSVLNSLSSKYGKVENKNTNTADVNKLYKAKTLNVNAELIKRINPATDTVNNYQKLSDDLKPVGNNPVEDKIIDNASKKMADVVQSNENDDASNAISSARERQIRQQVGQLKLNDVTFDKLTSVSDVPLPKPLTPIKLTTTNRGAIKGTSFINSAKEYEDKLLDRDIVATFMNLSKLPDGFYVTNVEVTDMSTVQSMINNWKVTLRNKKTDKQSVINIRVPKLFNGRFYNNGVWYNIDKQDFPIPILKIDSKTVIVTSNYNKITVERYDTRSLVDIGMLVKVVMSLTDKNGINPYIKPGSSVNTNSQYVSTIEYDEYAKRWFSYINKETNCEIYFNRQQCLKLYSFVSVNENEFCCGMINKVPIVINTDTGLTRDERTLTDTILRTLPVPLQEKYNKSRPGKLSMYAQIVIGVKMPLGVAIAAWEGLGSLLKKSNCKYQYVDKSFKDTKYFTIQFKDKTLAIQNTITNQLIFNGFYRINTKAYNTSDFDVPIMNSNSVFVDIFNQLFFKQYSQLTTFITYYNFFVDPITSDVCLHYNLPNDIAGMLLYSTHLLSDNSFTSESNSALFRIRSSEIIPAMIHYHLAKAISKYNNTTGSKSRDNSFNFNPNEIIHELVALPTVHPASALNPMIELHDREVITKKGFRGVNTDRAYTLAKRSYDDTMIGKMSMSSTNSGNVGIVRQLVADPKIESIRGYTSSSGVDADYNDLQLSSFSELLTPGTVTRDDAIRTTIATSQTGHIVATDGSQPVLISNGIDEIVPACLTEEFSVVAPEDGKVIDEADGYMIVEYKSGKKKAIDIGNRFSFNSGSGFHVNNKLLSNFKVGDSFKRGDILAYHEKFFSKDSDGIVRLNIGPLAKVAFTGLYSTYEDAGLVTTKMSKKLKTHITMCQTIKLSKTEDIERIVQVGDEVEINDPLIVFGLGDTGDKSVDTFLKSFLGNDKDSSIMDSVKRTIKSKHAGKVVDVRMYTTKSLDKLSPSLFKIFSEYFKTNIKKRKILDKYDKSSSVYKLDTLYSLPTEPLKGSTIKGQTCDVMIEIYVEHDDDASVGDKLVVYGASKQILSEVIPEGLEPYAESTPDEEISMFVAPSSILKRMIPSVMITAGANKVLLKLKADIKEIWESNQN